VSRLISYRYERDVTYISYECPAPLTRPEVRPLRILCRSCYQGELLAIGFSVQTFCAYGSAVYLYVHLELGTVGNMVGKVEPCLHLTAYFMWGGSALLLRSK